MSGLTDIPGLQLGHASDYDGLTGCTVVLAKPGPWPAAFQVETITSSFGFRYWRVSLRRFVRLQ